MAEVIGINGCTHEFAFDAAFAQFVPPQQIDGQAPHGSEVFGRLFGACASLIFAKDNVQHPMELVLNRPVAAHGLGKLVYVCRKAAQ